MWNLLFEAKEKSWKSFYKKKENESFVEEEDIFPIYLYICYLGYFGMSACQYVKSPTLRLVHWVTR